MHYTARLAFLVALIAVAASAGAVQSPGSKALAAGTVNLVGTPCHMAAVAIERGISPDLPLMYVGTGTGILSLTPLEPTVGSYHGIPDPQCSGGFVLFAGGQCFGCNGSCQVWTNGTAECWYGWGGSTDAPDPTQAGGLYMRLDPDGTFLYWDHYGPYISEYQVAGKLKRIA